MTIVIAYLIRSLNLGDAPLNSNNMVWIILSVVVMALIVFLMVTPLIIRVDTETNEYGVMWRGLASARILPDEKALIRIQIRSLFFDKSWFPLVRSRSLKEGAGAESTEKTKKGKKRKRKWRIRRPARRMLNVLRSFRLRELSLDLDTGDCISNGYLVPVFFFLSHGHRRLMVNYEGRVSVRIHIRNNLIRLLYAFIR